MNSPCKIVGFKKKPPEYITKLDEIPQLGGQEKGELREVEESFRFRTNEYYQSLIDWNDPNDPIRRIAMPQAGEIDVDSDWSLDASGEDDYTVVPGLQHKYENTALLLVNDVCGAYCRFCFRKRLFMSDNGEVTRDISSAIEYIKAHSEITNVLLTGGDPLILSTPILDKIISEIRKIEHVKIIRIGSKTPAFNPFRILGDPSLLEMLSRHSTDQRRIYLMAHFNHPRELTDVAVEALGKLQKAGVITINQTPLLRGINDDPKTLSELFEKLSFIGVPPYYLFQCRPTRGNEMFAVPVEESFAIFEEAQSLCSGLSRRARFVMSHNSGKIEVVGLTEKRIFMRYHRSPNRLDTTGIMAFHRNPEGYWFDDFDPESAESPIESTYSIDFSTR